MSCKIGKIKYQVKTIVIIVTYNGMQWIDRCLASVAGQMPELSVTVVDNGSKDGTAEFIQEHYPEVRLIQSESNLGFGQANNLGIRQAIEEQADYVYLLNQDAWIEGGRDTIDAMIRIQQQHPEYGILSPLQYNGAKTALDRNFASHCQPHLCPSLLNDLAAGQTRALYPARFVMAAHWLISRACLTTVGEFSPLYQLYGEDNNYIHRAHYHGFKVGICPSATGIHDRANRATVPAQKRYSMYYYSDFLQRIDNINRPLLVRYIHYTGRLSLKMCRWALQDQSCKPLNYIAKALSVAPQLYRHRKQNKKPFYTHPIKKTV